MAEKTSQPRRRASTPDPAERKNTENTSEAKATPPAAGASTEQCKASEADSAVQAPAHTSPLEAVPPQICALALGTNGLSRAVAAWSHAHGLADQFAPLVFTLALLAVAYLAIYCAKVVVSPAAFWRDASDPGTVAALVAGLAAVQVLAVKFHKENAVLSLTAAQTIIVVGYVLLVSGNLRFVLLNYHKGLWPDPSWFPGVLLFGMTNMTAFAVGPAWLQAILPAQFLFIMALKFPLQAVVTYRTFFSKSRMIVAPNAGMATLMAPGSFYTMCHLTSGKPGGDLVGTLLFADSTVFFLLAVGLLWFRRSLWARAFHPSYVAFTFPLASTAAAAVLASEKLPAVEGPWARGWATGLVLVAFCVISAVQLRFMWLVVRIFRPRFVAEGAAEARAKKN